MKLAARFVVSVVLSAALVPATMLSAQSTSSRSSGNSDAGSAFDILSGEDGKSVSISETIDKIMSSSKSEVIVENTEESVKSAIEGTLVFEEKIPDVNKEAVPPVDSKTKRYPPRVRLDFKEFPLRTISLSTVTLPGTPDGRSSGDVWFVPSTVFDKTKPENAADDTASSRNPYSAERIVDRLRKRLGREEIKVDFHQRTARLHGTVATPRQRELAEIMLRFEPGIETIRNELVIESN